MRRCPRENGTTTLTAAFFVVPILALALSLTLDLQTYLLDRSVVQAELDDAVVSGARMLPFHDKAHAAAARHVERHGSAATVSIGLNGIQAMVGLQAELSFARLLGIEAVVPYTLTARARPVPVDAAVVMDLGSYLAPALTDGAAWGDESVWPAAPYFESFPRQTTPPRSSRILTQQCFNPALSALKAAAYQAFDYLAAGPLNRVELAVFPAEGNQVETIHPFAPSGSSVVGFPQGVEPYVRSEDCARAAEEASSGSPYAFPLGRFQNPSPFRPLSMLQVDGSFDPSFASFLSAGEALWFRPVRTSALSAGADTGAVLRHVAATLLGGERLTSRGGLADFSERVGIILSGDVPRSGDTRFPAPQVVESLDQSLQFIGQSAVEAGISLRLYYLYFAGPGVADASVPIDAVAAFFESRSVHAPHSRFEAAAMYLPNGAALAATGIGTVLLEQARGVLAR